MGKGKNTTKKPAPNISIPNTLSVDKQIEIQAEAYYRALKRIERDKDQQKSAGIKPTPSNKDALLFFVNLLFAPKHMNIEKLKLQIADGLLNLLVTLVLDIIGYALRFFALAFWIYEIYSLINSHNEANFYILLFVIGLLLLVLGGIFNASSKELSKQTDQTRLYAYSSGIMASLAVVISVISFVLSLMK